MLNFPAGGFPANQPDRRTGCGTWNCLLRERALCPPGVGAAAGAVGTPGQGSAVRPGVGAQGALLLLLVPAAGLGVGGPRGGCSTQDPPGGWGWVAVGKVEQLVHISAAAVWGKFPVWETSERIIQGIVLLWDTWPEGMVPAEPAHGKVHRAWQLVCRSGLLAPPDNLLL